MILFSQSRAFLQVIVLLSMLILFVFQLYLQNMCYNYKEKRKFIFNTIPILATVFLTIMLIIQHNCAKAGILPLPLLAVIALTVLLYLHTLTAILHQKHIHIDMLTADSVKDAYEHIPIGLCFFAHNELPVLCNGQMSRITDELIGKSMQSLGELETALKQPASGVLMFTVDGRKIYKLADGCEWYFKKTEIFDFAGNSYIQVTAADHTELNCLNAELKSRNKELKKMMNRLERIRTNIAESIREQEILTAKMRLHNKMGNCMLGARRYLLQDCPKESKTELLERWQKTVSDLQDEIGQTDDGIPGEELIRIAKKLGVDIVLHGEFPKNSEIAYLFVAALRECLTNAIHHACASRLDLTITSSENLIMGIYTNNGKAPDKEITEGGGLTSLRSRIEKEGGTVKINSLNEFVLTVTLPKALKSEEDVDDD